MNFGYLSDGSWEAAVTGVVVAGQPKVVYTLGQRWGNLGDAVQKYDEPLKHVVETLFGGRHGWHGPAAREYEKVVKELIKEITKLSDDCTQLGSYIDDAGAALSTAISSIPVPLDKDTAWYGDVDHRLPGGAKFDDSLHDKEKFHDSLVDDYQHSPSSYRNFLSSITVGNAADRLSNARTATRGGGGRYGGTAPDHADPVTGQPSPQNQQQAQQEALARRLAAWYNANAAIATKAFNELKSHYHDQRSYYREIASRKVDLRVGSGKTHDGRDGAYAEAGTYGYGSGFVTDPDGSRIHPDVPEDLVRGVQLGSSSGADSSGPTDAGVTHKPDLSGLAGNSGAIPGGAGSAGRIGLGVSPGTGGSAGGGGFGGGPDVGAIPGLVRAGSATSGPSMSPVPPLTSARDAVLGPKGTPSARGSAGPTGMGMMPHGGGQANRRDERTSWLTEDDEDIWRGVPLGPPSVIE